MRDSHLEVSKRGQFTESEGRLGGRGARKGGGKEGEKEGNTCTHTHARIHTYAHTHREGRVLTIKPCSGHACMQILCVCLLVDKDKYVPG